MQVPKLEQATQRLSEGASVGSDQDFVHVTIGDVVGMKMHRPSAGHQPDPATLRRFGRICCDIPARLLDPGKDLSHNEDARWC